MEQHIKCPRCDSLDTKFSYYNNYSVLQPRYKCKTCNRYWTQGGALKDVPVGGGSRPRNKPRCTRNSSSSSTSAEAPPAPPQPLSQEMVQNQGVSPSMNPISQPINHSLNGGASNVVVSYSDLAIQNQIVNPSIPFYHQGSGGARGGYYYVVDSRSSKNSSTSFTLASPQPPAQQVIQNQLVSPSLNPLSQPFNQLVSPPVPITSTYHQPFNHSLNPISQPFNQSLNGDDFVMDYSNLALLSGFDDAADSLVTENRIRSQIRPVSGLYQMEDNGGIDSSYPAGQVLTQPSVARNNPADQWLQSFINNDNNLASDDITWSDIYNITSNISGNSDDQNISEPNNLDGLPGYGPPQE